MASAGTLLALLLGIPLALWDASHLPGSGAVRVALGALRAIPDLTLAICAVVIVGLGPAAGVVALTAFYAAMIGRMYAELLGTAPQPLLESLASTGASRLVALLYGAVPSVGRDLLTFGAYAFECAIRASIVVGAVGAGGLGTEIVGSINALDYRRVAELVVVLVGIVWLADWCGARIRRRPLLALLLVPLGIAGLLTAKPVVFAPLHALGVFAGMFPPLLDGRDLVRLPGLILETLEIGVLGTLLAVAAALPLGLFASRRFVPPLVSLAVRRALDVLRSVPEVVVGLVLVVAVGIGPGAGALALAIHSAGVLGKLFAESLENVPAAALEALAATGAGPIAVAGFGGFPLALGAMAEHAFFRLEWNLRTATIVGMIGAGGIGQALFNSQQTFHYHAMLAYVLVTWLFVFVAEALANRGRLLIAGR